MHKLTPPAAHCPKCGCENAFSTRVPRYLEIMTSTGTGRTTGVMVWECRVCGFAMHTEPLDGKARRRHLHRQD